MCVGEDGGKEKGKEGKAPHRWMSGQLLGVGPLPPVWVKSIELGVRFSRQVRLPTEPSCWPL